MAHTNGVQLVQKMIATANKPKQVNIVKLYNFVNERKG